DHGEAAGPSRGALVLAAAAGLGLGLALAPRVFHNYDVVDCFLTWARASAGQRPWDIYLTDFKTNCDYPPLVPYLLTLAEAARRGLGTVRRAAHRAADGGGRGAAPRAADAGRRSRGGGPGHEAARRGGVPGAGPVDVAPLRPGPRRSGRGRRPGRRHAAGPSLPDGRRRRPDAAGVLGRGQL